MKRLKTKFKKLFAFSLIELLISLIVISTITAATTPIVTKKLTKGTIKINSMNNISGKCGTKFGPNCLICVTKTGEERCISCTLSCPIGQYKDTQKCECVACNTIDINCLACNTGKQCTKCKPGYYVANAFCKICETGYKCDGTNRESCPAGTCGLTQGKDKCDDCPSGNYCTGGSAKATCVSKTPKCTQCDPKTGTCTKCQEGYYIDGTACKICPAGSKCTNGIEKITCPAGTYNAAQEQTTCKTCEKGYGCSGGQNHTACKAAEGKYSPTTGMPVCLACGADTYAANDSGSHSGTALGTKCIQCGADKVCSGGIQISCQKGKYPNESGVCTNCLQGTYSTNGLSCTACPAGTHGSAAGATSSATCEKCGKGYYSPSEGSAACSKCSTKNRQYSNTEGATECKTCPAGQFSRDVNGAWSSDYAGVECANCSGKYVCPASGGVTTCAAGKVPNSNHTGCSKCSTKNGKYSAAGASSCSTCEAGTLSADKDGKWRDSTDNNNFNYLDNPGTQCKPCTDNGNWVCTNGTARYCPKVITNCAKCELKQEKCKQCKDGYYLTAKGKCVVKTPNSQSYCNAIGDNLYYYKNTCVTKYNLHKNAVANTTSCTADQCCWKKDNSVSCTVYSAKSICDNYALGNAKNWRLPTEIEAKDWYPTIKIDADRYECKGAITWPADNKRWCYPATIWSTTDPPRGSVRYRYISVEGVSGTPDSNGSCPEACRGYRHGFGVRCVFTGF